MSNEVYNGTSDGFAYVSDGYIDYAKEIISARSFPDLRDGLKPLGRRTVFKSREDKLTSLVKCSTIVGRVMQLHPHGDSAIYGGLCLMTDLNGAYNFPLFEGQGGLGKVGYSKKPAAMRYTKACLSKYSDYLFRDMEACNLLPAEEGEGLEPEVLPVPFPLVLVNGTTGMAVGVASAIPSFNFHDVLDLTIKYLKNGDLGIDDVISPDFPTGGILVKDDSELTKIMLTGKGSLKIRAKVEICDKEIIVKEIPFGKTVENIVATVRNLASENQNIVTAKVDSGKSAKGRLTVICKTKKSVEGVLKLLYHKRILQTNFPSNITVVENGEPYIIGVYDIVKKWCKWREKVCKLKLEKNIASVKHSMINYDYFVRLVSNEEWKDSYVSLATKKGRKEAGKYLLELFEDIPDDTAKWINERPINAFHKGGEYIERYKNLEKQLKTLEDYLGNITQYIVDSLESIKREQTGNFARKTELTYQDYKFSKISDTFIEDDSYAVFTMYKNGFLKKTRGEASQDGALINIPARANSILIGFDNYGRVVKVIGSEVPFHASTDKGLYLPKYFEAVSCDDYEVMYLGLLDGKTRMLIYKDGFVGFLNTSEWVDKKRIKIIKRGVDLTVFDSLLEVVEEEDIPEYLMVADDHFTTAKFGIAKVSDILVKSRRSRTRVFSGKNLQINYWAGLTLHEMVGFMEDTPSFFNKMKPYKEIYGDPAILQEGRFYEEGYKLRDMLKDSSLGGE